MPVVAALVSVGTAVVLIVMWHWVDGVHFGDDAKKAAAHLEVVKVASAIAVGGGGLFALYLSARRQRTTERELRHVELDAAERRVTELYTKAADQLGSDKAPVRLAGLYALERLADGAPQHRRTVIDLLCAYLRMPFEQPAQRPPAAGDDRLVVSEEHRKWTQEREVRLTAQRILANRLRRGGCDSGEATGKPNTPEHWLGPINLDLTSAVLIDFDLTGCTLHTAVFARATFLGNTSFSGTAFTGETRFDAAVFGGLTRFDRAAFCGRTVFSAATFEDHVVFHDSTFDGGAVFARAVFASAVGFENVAFAAAAAFDYAKFTGDARFAKAVFAGSARFNNTTWANGAVFDAASFEGSARFDAARFGGAAWFGSVRFGGDAWFIASTFASAEFTGATFERGARFDRSRFDGHTEFDRATFGNPATMQDVQLSPSSQRESQLPRRRWPTGWTVEQPLRSVEPDHRKQRLVPVPVVLD